MAISNLAVDPLHAPDRRSNPASEAATGADLAKVDKRVHTVFTQLNDSLTRVREGGQAMGVTLERLTAASTQCAQPLGQSTPLQERISQAQALFDGAASIDRTSSLHEVERRAEAALENVRHRGKFLWATSSIIESTAASMHLDAFRAYGQELRATAHALMTHAEHVSEKIQELSSLDAVLMASARKAAEALGRLRDSLCEGEELGARLEEEKTEAGRQLARACSGAKTEVNREISGLSGMIQFSDQMTQRLDHIRQITQAGPGYGRLAGAQLHALADDLEAAVRDANARLDRLKNVTIRQDSDAGDGGFAGAISAVLRYRSEMLVQASAQSAPVIRASEEADRGRAIMDNTLAELEKVFVELEKAYDKVSQASINSMILAARTGDNQKALSTLAIAVKEVADHCIVSVKAGRDAMEQIKACILKLSQEATEAATGLAAALNEARAGLADSETFVAGIESAKSAVTEAEHAMSDIVASVLGELRPLDQIAPTLRDIAGRVDWGQPLEKEGLSRLFAIYSMERERNVHARACGLHMAPPEPPAPAAPATQGDDDALDGIDFF